MVNSLRNTCETQALAFWSLRSDDLRTKAGRLQNAGWQGLTACSISRRERDLFNGYLTTLRRPDYALMHGMSFDDCDARIGEFRQNQVCIWFRKERAFEDCFAILRSIPMRSVEFVVNEVEEPLRKLLRPLNYRMLKGSNGTLVSVVANIATLQAAQDFGITRV